MTGQRERRKDNEKDERTKRKKKGQRERRKDNEKEGRTKRKMKGQ